MNNKIIFSAAYLLLGSSFALTSCQSEDKLAEVTGGEVMLSVTANRGDIDTRTTLTEQEGNLVCTWNAGDKLVVADNNGNNLGVVELVSGEGTHDGVFEGLVKLGNLEAVKIAYLGTGYEGELSEAKGKINYDFTQQNGSFSSLTEKDYLAAETLVTNFNNGTAKTEDITLIRNFAFGYFSLALPDGVTLAKGDVITISAKEGTRLQASMNITLGNTSTSVTTANETITITKEEAGNDFYITMLPFAATPEFKVIKDGIVYTASLAEHNWQMGEYVRANDSNDPISVTEWTKETQPINPGDLDNWGSNSDKISMTATPIGPYFHSESGGWIQNIRNLHYMGGWCLPVEYTNGLYNGLLTSDAASCFYFQWGRYLGFPSNVAGVSKTAPGASNLDVLVGYLSESGTPVKYTAAYMGKSSGYNLTRSLEWSIVFGQTNNNQLDYLYGNGSHGSWEERSGNPCPDGYRIPTWEELSVFVPTSEEVNGSYAEIKTINGTKYAMKWVVGSSSNISYVDVYSVATTLSSISVNSSVFDGVTPKRIWAYGYLMNDGKQSGWGDTAVYWSTNSDKNNALDNVSGYGGLALYIEFSGNTAVFAPGITIPFGFGAPVMPVKDSSAKAIKIRPIFPYSYDYRELKTL